MTKDETLQEIIAGAKANGSWDKKYPDDKKAQPAQEPPSEWAGIKAILDEYGLQAIDFVADWKAAQEPVDDVRGFLAARLTCWHRLTQKESNELVALFEVKPPQRPWVGLTDEETAECFEAKVISDRLKADAKRIGQALKEKNT